MCMQCEKGQGSKMYEVLLEGGGGGEAWGGGGQLAGNVK